MPKYADPTVYPVSAPAATDTVMTRTAAGADGNFALGNLAGIAPVVVAANQSVYFNGTVWTPYTVTAVGRDLLVATTQAAQRTAIQAVGTVGDEAIAGTKTFTGLQIRMQSNAPGFWLDEADNTYGCYVVLDGQRLQFQRRDSNFGGNPVGLFGLGLGDNPTAGIRATLTPTAHNTFSLGQVNLAWTQVFAQNTTITPSDARLKTDPRNMRPAEAAAFAAIARLPNVWRWLQRVHGDESCEPEGREARKHGGPTVQAAMAIMEANGLDPFEYSCFCYDQWEAEPEQWNEWPEERDEDGNVIREAGREMVQEARPAGDRYSFRKEELLCLCMTAMAIQHDDLESRVAALEKAAA